MLRKLMKHELRATARIMIPLLLLVLVTAVGANLSTRWLMGAANDFANLLGGILMMLFAISMFAACIMSAVVMIRRFYGNVLGDEGYLTMTLPVSVHQQVWSKLLVSALWFALTAVAAVLALWIVVYDADLARWIWNSIPDLLRELTLRYALNGAALTAEFLVLALVGCFTLCLKFYAAMAVGHSFSRHKLLYSVLFYFGADLVLDILGGILLLLFNETPLQQWLLELSAGLGEMTAVYLGMGVSILGVLLYGTIFYFLTTWFLKYRLNLE